MYRFFAEYYPYFILNVLALFFLFASIMGIPGNPDDNKRKKLIINILEKLFIVTFRGIPLLSGITLIAFIFNYENTGKIISYINFVLGLSMIVLMATYYSIKANDKI